MSKYFPPTHGSTHFHCPYCHVYAEQRWDHIRRVKGPQIAGVVEVALGIKNARVEVSVCQHCDEPTFWLEKKTIYPHTRIALPANSDLSDSVKSVYEEASVIANQSPRAACALLRLAIEMLLKELGETGSINEAIKNLVANGLDPKVRQSLDVVRVIGNNAVHPGAIEFDDTTDVHILFQLINVIADTLITQPKQIQEIHDNLPEDARKAIEKRDGQTK